MATKTTPPALVRPKDNDCNYSTFRALPGGKIACLAYGPRTPLPNELANASTAEITGIAFQKVDTGIVKALLPSNDFSIVNWEDAPTKPAPRGPPQQNQFGEQPILNLNNPIPLAQAAHVEPQWQDFTNVMKHVRTAMLGRMVSSNGRNPGSLLKGFNKNIWIGAPENILELIGTSSRVIQIQTDIGTNGTNESVINDWIYAICSGLYTAVPEMKNLFKFLFPNCETTSQQSIQKIVAAPSETSRNGQLSDGVVHCLSYGFHESQKEPREGRPRTKAFGQSPIRYRMLRPKRSEVKARSRSRSPVNEKDQSSLADDVLDQLNPHYDPDFDDLFDDPDTYVLKPENLHLYFESHRPDLLLFKVTVNVPDQDLPGCTREEVQVKILFKLSSFEKFAKASLSYHVQSNTEQCVQCCLSAFTFNQTLIYGVVVVVDGLKLVKVEKRVTANGRVEYDVSETDLITWDRTDALHSLFQMIAGIL